MPDYSHFSENALTGESLGNWTRRSKRLLDSEPWFASSDSPRSEDRGYIITFVLNDKTKVQELQVFDALISAAAPARGPKRSIPFSLEFMRV